MANNGPVITPPAAAGPDIASHNADIAKKLAEQDIMGRSSAPEFNADADKALDALLADAQKKSETPEGDTSAGADAKADAEKQAAEAAEKTKADEKAKAEADAKAAEEAEILKKADENLFKGAQSLAPNASQKSADAFRDVKIRAARREAELEAKIAELSKVAEEAKKSAGQPTKEQLDLQAELNEHKKWRAKLDVEADPKYREYDKTIETASEFIYAQLKKHSVIGDDVIAEIKKHGGPDRVKLDKVFELIKDDQTKTLVTSKLADIAVARYNKDQAIAAAKTNIDDYLKAKQEESTKATTAFQDEVKKELDAIWAELPWTKKREIAATASDADKTAAANHNKFIEQIRGELEEGMKNDSPKLRATLLTGIAQLFNLQNVHEALKKSYDAMEKEVKELREYKDRVKKASTSRLQESNAPSGGIPQVQKPQNIFNTPATDALDALRQQVTQERQAKLGASA